ncbi:ribokinase [Bacillus sp. B1-b2]|uniref:ribokinase n=1 Tax=Bacillus sp. B1-b2 TaxID=2653201 RepID=UPI001261F4E8|nr:ribokinase [Bacillus sp. B1-b2]KAB7667105.1 ribokinase [Bacillus sp. B1-b2]
MKFLNFGSLNIDKVYSVPHFVSGGETLSSTSLEEFPGGKGLNQSLAFAKAGANVHHAGKIGKDGLFLKDLMQSQGVNVKQVTEDGSSTGHAIIQVSTSGENCILLYGGANQEITKEQIDSTLAECQTEDVIVLQNEMNHLEYMLDTAARKELTIALNPSPINPAILKLDYHKIHYLILNEIEAKAISGEEKLENIFTSLLNLNPQLKIVLTLGTKGVIYKDSTQEVKQDAFPVHAVDTTAAGDTFLGYFLSIITKYSDVEKALKVASKASSIAVTRKGAASSIPSLAEVLTELGI